MGLTGWRRREWDLTRGWMRVYCRQVERHPLPFIIIPTLLALASLPTLPMARVQLDFVKLFTSPKSAVRTEQALLRRFESLPFNTPLEASFSAGPGSLETAITMAGNDLFSAGLELFDSDCKDDQHQAGNYTSLTNVLSVFVRRANGLNILQPDILRRIHQMSRNFTQSIQSLSNGKEKVDCDMNEWLQVGVRIFSPALRHSPNIRFTFPIIRILDYKIDLGSFILGPDFTVPGLPRATGVVLHFRIGHSNSDPSLGDAFRESASYWNSKNGKLGEEFLYTAVGGKEFDVEVAKVGQHMAAGLPYSAVALSVYLLLFSLSAHCGHLTPVPSFAAVLSVILSLCTTVGLLCVSQFMFNPIMAITPFLILAIGVDDAFLMLWGRAEGGGLDEVGSSILATTLTDALTFMIGAFLSPSPAVASFCVFTAVAVVMDFVYQLSFFLGILFSYDALRKRYRSRRYSIFSIYCCPTRGSSPTSRQTAPFALSSLKKTNHQTTDCSMNDQQFESVLNEKNRCCRPIQFSSSSMKYLEDHRNHQSSRRHPSRKNQIVPVVDEIQQQEISYPQKIRGSDVIISCETMASTITTAKSRASVDQSNSRRTISRSETESPQENIHENPDSFSLGKDSTPETPSDDPSSLMKAGERKLSESRAKTFYPADSIILKDQLVEEVNKSGGECHDQLSVHHDGSRVIGSGERGGHGDSDGSTTSGTVSSSGGNSEENSEISLTRTSSRFRRLGNDYEAAHQLLARYYSTSLVKRPLRILGFVAFVIYLIVALIGCSRLKIDLDPRKMTINHSPLNQYFTLAREYFYRDFVPVDIYIILPQTETSSAENTNRSRVTHLSPGKIKKLLNFLHQLETHPLSNGPETTDFWLRDFLDFSTSAGAAFGGAHRKLKDHVNPPNGYAGQSVLELNERVRFAEQITAFLSQSEYQRFKSAIKFEGIGSPRRTYSANNSITSQNQEVLPGHQDHYAISRRESKEVLLVSSFTLRVYYSSLGDSWALRYELIQFWRELSRNYSSEFESVIRMPQSLYLDQYPSIGLSALQSIGSAITAMSLIAALFISEPLSVFIVSSSLLSISAGVMGFSQWLGADMDHLSVGFYLASVGFAIDFSLHVVYRINRNPEDLSSVEGVAWPILQAALSTVVAVLPLMIADTYVSQSFCWTVILVMLMGGLHGLGWLPQFLFALQSHPSSPLRADRLSLSHF